jgi:hypothetical protein
MSTKEVIKRRAIWRVGDGKSIKVWGDCWLPTPMSYSVQSPSINLRDNTLVAELIDQENRRWDGTLIEANFLKEEAEVNS